MDCDVLVGEHFRQPAYELRATAYSWVLPEPVKELRDPYDDEAVIFGVRGEHGNFVGTVRINERPMPFEQYYNVTPDDNSIEISKLAIDPTITSPEMRAKVLKLLSAAWLKYAEENNIKSIYAAAAQETVAKFYSTLVGFRKVDAAVYRPATFEVDLLKGDVQDMLGRRMVRFIMN
jgi:hypothetical protein